VNISSTTRSPVGLNHDPIEIWEKTKEAVGRALKEANISINDIKAMGIDNQGETVLVWDKNTGVPVYNAIVWQDRRTSEMADRLKEEWEMSSKRRPGWL